MAEKKIKVLIDHRSLEYFMIIKKPNRRQIKWTEMLSEFEFKIMYRSRKQGEKPVALTRKSQDLLMKAEDTRNEYQHQMLSNKNQLNDRMKQDDRLCVMTRAGVKRETWMKETVFSPFSLSLHWDSFFQLQLQSCSWSSYIILMILASILFLKSFDIFLSFHSPQCGNDFFIRLKIVNDSNESNNILCRINRRIFVCLLRDFQYERIWMKKKSREFTSGFSVLQCMNLILLLKRISSWFLLKADCTFIELLETSFLHLIIEHLSLVNLFHCMTEHEKLIFCIRF